MDDDVDSTERSTQTLLKRLSKLGESFEFNLAVGAFALTVGVIITAATFKDHNDNSATFLIGPAFIAGGVVIMGRAVLFKVVKNYGPNNRRRRRRSGADRLEEEEYTGHIRIETNSASALRYADDPPPYDAALASSIPNVAVSQTTLSTDISDDPLPPPPSYEEAIQSPPVTNPESTESTSSSERLIQGLAR